MYYISFFLFFIVIFGTIFKIRIFKKIYIKYWRLLTKKIKANKNIALNQANGNSVLEQTNKYTFMWDTGAIKNHVESFNLNKAIFNQIEDFFHKDSNLQKYCKILDKEHNYIRFSIFNSNYLFLFQDFKIDSELTNKYIIKREITSFNEITRTTNITSVEEASHQIIFKMQNGKVINFSGANRLEFTPELFISIITSVVK